jgi:acyl-CoA synthetase (AMP-forming)/AMP-acid ligase II
MSDLNLCAIMERAAESKHGLRFLDRRENEKYLPYGQILERVLGVAGALQKRGLKPGDKVALVLPTCPEFIFAFWGALFAGAVPVPLYPPVRLGRMDEYHERTARMLAVSQARIVLTDSRIKRVLGRSLAQANPDLGCEIVKEVGNEDYAPAEISPDAPGLIQFSSGTTRDPKPVLLTHRQILANVKVIEGAILKAYPEPREPEHCGVSWLPLYHDMGLIGCVMLAVYHPAELTLIPPEMFIARPAIWLRALSKYKGSISPAPNFAYSYCTDRIKDEQIEGIDLSNWTCALNGAEPVTVAALERFIERFGKHGFKREAITPVYGLAEAALAVTFSDLGTPFAARKFDPGKLLQGTAEPSEDGKRLVSVGIPLPGYEVKILGEDGTPCPEGKLGALYAKGPSIMKGYFNKPEATAAALKDGWLDTGDTGFLSDGELFLYGRAKDLIVIRGKNYAPQTIELAIDELPGARKGCVAAVGFVPEGGENERLLVFIERDASGDQTGDEELSKTARRKITAATGLSPFSVVVLEPGTLPRTSSGKLRRNDALKQHLAGTLAPPKDVTVWSMTAEMIRSTIAYGITRKR